MIEVYGAYRAQSVPQAPMKKQPMKGGEMTPIEKEKKEKEGKKEEKNIVVAAPIEEAKYTGSTIRLELEININIII